MALSPQELFISDRPDKDSLPPPWEIKRADPNKPLMMVCVSSKIVGTHTHFFEKRTQPCVKTDCKGCAAGRRREWHGYLLAQDAKDMRKWCVELTAVGAQPLVDAFDVYHSLRGVQFILERAERKANGKVLTTVRGMWPKPLLLAEEEPTWPIVFRIWGIALTAAIPERQFTRDNLNEHEAKCLPKETQERGHDDEWLAARKLEVARDLGAIEQADGNLKLVANGRRRAR